MGTLPERLVSEAISLLLSSVVPGKAGSVWGFPSLCLITLQVVSYSNIGNDLIVFHFPEIVILVFIVYNTIFYIFCSLFQLK